MSETVSFQVLKERFPSEIVNPFGEVLIIPRRLFERGWELELEAQGHHVFVGNHNGEAAFLVRLDKSKPKNIEKSASSGIVNRFTISPNAKDNKLTVESPASSGISNRFENSPSSKVDRWKRWTREDERKLIAMAEAGHDFEKIGEALGRSSVAVERKLTRTKGKITTQGDAGSKPAMDMATKPNTNDNDSVVKELLAAASELYPKYRHACRFLLLETSRLLGEE